jgi:Zn-dependent protease with chaperone function
LNAFAAQATGYDYVVLANELFVNLHNGNRDGLRFILGHELGHIRLHHVSLWYQLAVAYSQLIPLLGPLLSRLRGFWVGLAQLPRSHPFTVRRLERLYAMGLFHADAKDAEMRV